MVDDINWLPVKGCFLCGDDWPEVACVFCLCPIQHTDDCFMFDKELDTDYCCIRCARQRAITW